MNARHLHQSRELRRQRRRTAALAAQLLILCAVVASPLHAGVDGSPRIEATRTADPATRLRLLAEAKEAEKPPAPPETPTEPRPATPPAEPAPPPAAAPATPPAEPATPPAEPTTPPAVQTPPDASAPVANQCRPDPAATGITRIILRPGATALTIEQIKTVFGPGVVANPIGDGSFVIDAPGTLTAPQRDELARCFGEGAKIFVDAQSRPLQP